MNKQFARLLYTLLCFVAVSLPLLLDGAPYYEYLGFFSVTLILSSLPVVGTWFVYFSIFFGGINIASLMIIGQVLYLEQILALFTETRDVLGMSKGLVHWYHITLVAIYSIITAALYRVIHVSAVKKWLTVLLSPFILIPLIMGFFHIDGGFKAYSPFQHILNAGLGLKTSTIVYGEKVEPAFLADYDVVKKVVFIIGESQTNFSGSGVDKDVAPFLFGQQKQGSLLILENVVQSGSFTALSHAQILEATSFKDMHEPHVPLYNVAKHNESPWAISSRNWGWAGLVNYMHGFNRYDCADVNPKCGMLGSVDDMEMLNDKIVSLLAMEEYFIVWQMNGSHTPLDDKYSKDLEVEGSEYLSSVRYTDHVLEKLFSYLDDDVWVVFMSDHSADRTGEVNKVAAFIANGKYDFTEIARQKNARLTHFDLIGTIYNLVGFEYTNSEYYNVLTDTVSEDRKRITYNFADAEDYKVVLH